MKISQILFFSLITSSVSAQPPVVNGWTQFAPSSDSRIIYVSSSDGNDATAQNYSTASAEIGNDPFLPAGTIYPYQTLSAASAQLRNGYADWLLFKKGDVFNNQNFGVTTLNGKNKNEPMLIASYGSSCNRPVINTGNQTFIDLTGASASFLAFAGLHIEAGTRSGTDEPIGFRIIMAPFDNILIEDCHITKFFQNLAMHDPVSQNATRSNLRVRRSCITDAYVISSAHANAMFIANIDTVLFEENLLDHNGWSSSVLGANPTGFRHNSYFQVTNRNVFFRENIVARAAATGGGIRSGGIVFDNTFLSNPQNLQFGTHETTINWPAEFVSGEVSYNVVLDSRTESFEAGKGINIQRTKNTDVHHNIVAHFTPVSDYNLALFFNETENVQVRENIIYNWGNNTSSGPAYSGGIVAGASLLGTNQIYSNAVQIKNMKGFCQIKYGTFDNIFYSDNNYYNVVSSNNWFEPSGSYSVWLSESSEINSSVIEINYPDPARNVETYLSSLGISGDLETFLESRRNMNKCNWNDDYTANNFNNYIREGFGQAPVNTVVQPVAHPISVFPNPVQNGILQVSSRNEKIREIKLLDSNGIMLQSRYVNVYNETLYLNNLSEGMFFLNVVTEKNSKVIRVVSY